MPRGTNKGKGHVGTIVPISGGSFPGQASNPVGFAAAPGFTGLTSGVGVTLTSGTASSPTIISFKDFSGFTSISSDLTAGGAPVQFIKFVGCRFQNSGNSAWCANCLVPGSTNITFSYCSFVPLVSNNATPRFPGMWPSAGVGTGVSADPTSPPADWGTQGLIYGIPNANGYQAALLPGQGPTTLDHCDIWGFANAVTFSNSTTGQHTINSCWIHDPRYDLYPPIGPADHTDGPGFLEGLAAPSNIQISSNTIAFIGNTNCIAFQSASTPYSNIIVINNYLSGDLRTLDMCHNLAGNTGLVCRDNILATDMAFMAGFMDRDFTANFNGTGNIWRNNKLRFYPGDTWSGYTVGQDGQYIWPDQFGTTATHATDWTL